MSELINKLGFAALDRQRYLSLMSEQTFDYFREMADYEWFIYDGDLEIDPRDITLFSETSALITGNLTVRGVLDYQDISALFVLGSVKASSILLSSSHVYFAGVTSFEEVMIVMGGSGAPVSVVDPRGPFVYNDSDAAFVSATKTHVDVFVDLVDDESFGDPSNVLLPQFIAVGEDNLSEIQVDAICDAVIEGKPVATAPN